MESGARDVVELACLQNSRVKAIMPSGVTVGQEIDSAFRSNNSIGDRLVCEIQRSNTHSDVAIAIKRGSQVIWHVPERLARIPSPMMKDG